MDKNEKKEQSIKEAIRERTISYILAAFGLVVGLAWNDAIRSFIEYIFPLQQNSLLAKFIYALLLTIVLVLISIYFTKLFQREEKDK
jgi:hypothetical protein